jgi:hypothetical protein
MTQNLININDNDLGEPKTQPGEVGAAAMRYMVDTTPHAGGSLNTTPSLISPTTRLPIKPAIESLDDDTPLEGGACNLGGDCEACQ